MVNILNEVNEVVTRRIFQLQKDIDEAESLLSMYRTELEPLLKIAEVSGGSKLQPLSITPGACETPLEEVPVPVRTLTEGGNANDNLSRRWRRYSLAPRHRLFLDRFSGSSKITREAVVAWYKRLNPNIKDSSLKSGVSEITGCLVRKGILRKVSTCVWAIIR